MSADLLERATRALRETTEADPAALDRVLDRLERPKRSTGLSMRPVRIIAWTLAGSLLGVGAWASATGRVHWFVPEPPSAPPEPAATAPLAVSPPRERPRRRPLDAPPEPSSEPAPAVFPEPGPPESRLREPAPPASAPSPSRRAPSPGETRRRPDAPKVADADPALAPTVDSDALYRTAHEAHFARADYAEALALWDRYLDAAEPGHRWKIEARYNRGIALYRLGRAQQAREALEPFARGEYGAYRRDDARRLLEALAPPRSN